MICPLCNRESLKIVRGFCSSCYTVALRKGQIQKIKKIPIPRKFSSEQEEIVNGLLLGDGCLNIDKKRKKISPRLANTRQLIDFDYLQWQYEKLKDFYSTPPKTYVILDNRTENIYQSCYANSRTGQIFLDYYYNWYPNQIKIVPKDIKLTPMSLLVWFLDDGCVVKSSEHGLTIKFATDGFAKEDVDFLAELLGSYVGETINVYKNDDRFILKAATLAAVKVINIIDPIFLSCMERKRTWKNFDWNYFYNNRNQFGNNQEQL